MAEAHAGYIDVSLNAEADLSADRYCAVIAGANARGCNVAGANGVVIGILQNAPKQNETAVVRVFGPAKTMVDGTNDITVRAFLEADQYGHLVPSTTNLHNVACWAMEPMTENGPRVIETFVSIGILNHS